MLHDTMRRPRTLLDLTQGLPVLTKVPHQRSNCFNHVGIPRTVPSQFVATSKGCPQIRVRIYKAPIQAHNIKAFKAYNWKHSDIILRYTSLINISPAESPVLWSMEIELNVFNAGSRNVAVSKSRHRLLFSPTRKGQKHSKIPFRDVSRFGR